MLKRDSLAKKFAKYKLLDVVKDNKDSTLKKAVSDALELAYATGYDLAVEECHKENSRSGDDMYYYLKDLQDDNTQAL